MTSRSRRLALTAAAVVAGGFLFTSVLLPRPQPETASYPFGQTPASTLPTTPAPMLVHQDQRSYALAAARLQGLPPNAAPGTPLELWVTWDPPLTQRPRVQLLLRSVTLEQLVPGPTPEAPVTAVLALRKREIPKLIFAERYGAISVTRPTGG